MANPEQLVVKRKVPSDSLQDAVTLLEGLDGVDKVEPLGLQRLRISYDVTQVDWATITRALNKIGIHSGTGRFARWRDSWQAFIEQNVRDNLNYKPACCSKPPAGAGLRSKSARGD